MAYHLSVTFSKTNQYGCGPIGEDDVYTVEEFQQHVVTNGFIDYDGFGHPVKNRLADPDIIIKPSRTQDIPKDATHIVWYNR